ncbi:hypothetical protein M409DRAFT_49260 [Zasmidium cellare ATCC 36951]|uniref:Uncharacterized protein n=1 Tax=Zasmidium cellare ATCC 36951 TaxID=1080233 RepID=A0A6A6D3G1_ZASCE|nr:uncharacterized protein M409DRAFT_49260 [Zasmidium cellare ATCC 36951]KAF2172722.1 hypothetical protein M409DRAFT_49260 [Zasmidium cellare ATCC 36951]
MYINIVWSVLMEVVDSVMGCLTVEIVFSRKTSKSTGRSVSKLGLAQPLTTSLRHMKNLHPIGGRTFGSSSLTVARCSSPYRAEWIVNAFPELAKTLENFPRRQEYVAAADLEVPAEWKLSIRTRRTSSCCQNHGKNVTWVTVVA